MRAGGRDFVLEAEGALDRSAWMRVLEDAQREHPRWDADAAMIRRCSLEAGEVLALAPALA